jgi:hypothetical protein
LLCSDSLIHPLLPRKPDSIMARCKKSRKRSRGPESSNTSRVLEWSLNVPLPRRSTRERKLPNRYGFAMSNPTVKLAPKGNPNRRFTSQDLDQAQSTRSKSPSNRASDITDVDELERYDPPIYFKPTCEFEGAVRDGDDEAISLQLQNLIDITQIKRTATHSGVIPLALKVEFTSHMFITLSN